MALAETMGWNNPFTQFVGNNRQTLMGLGAGIAGGTNLGEGLSAGLQMASQGRQADEAAIAQKQAEAQRQQGLNATIEFMRQKGYDDLVAGVEGGGLDMGSAWGEALKRGQPGYGQADSVKPMEINGQLVNPMTGAVLGDYRDPNAGQAAPPSGYQWTPDGGQTYIPGGPADPSTPAKTTEATRRNQQLASMIGPELQTVEANWNDLSNGANQAANAVPFGAGYAATSPGYQQATNALGTIAQSYLYSVSGAAAPADEVRKLVESVTPRPFESQQSVDAKKARVRQMAAAVQEAAGGVPAPTAAPGGQTSTGLSWSIEP